MGNSLHVKVKGRVKVKSKMFHLGDLDKDWDDKARRVRRKKINTGRGNSTGRWKYSTLNNEREEEPQR